MTQLCVDIGRAARAARRRGLSAFGPIKWSKRNKPSYLKILNKVLGPRSAAARTCERGMPPADEVMPHELKVDYDAVFKEDVLRSMQKHTEERSQDADAVGMSGHSGRVCAPSSFDIGERRWSCPVQPLLEKLVAVLDQDSQTKSTALNQLVAMWKGKHLGMGHGSAAQCRLKLRRMYRHEVSSVRKHW